MTAFIITIVSVFGFIIWAFAKAASVLRQPPQEMLDAKIAYKAYDLDPAHAKPIPAHPDTVLLPHHKAYFGDPGYALLQGNWQAEMTDVIFDTICTRHLILIEWTFKNGPYEGRVVYDCIEVDPLNNWPIQSFLTKDDCKRFARMHIIGGDTKLIRSTSSLIGMVAVIGVEPKLHGMVTGIFSPDCQTGFKEELRCESNSIFN